MSNQRAWDQTCIAVALACDLPAAIDTRRKEVGQDRSTFIRSVLAKELRGRNYDLPEGIEFARERVGRPRHPARVSSKGLVSKVDTIGRGALQKQVAKLREPKSEVGEPSGKTSEPEEGGRTRPDRRRTPQVQAPK